MKSIAILPLRKGSKGIPGKNKKLLLGRPLYQWVLGEAIQSNLDEIYVFTDDEDILLFIEHEYAWTNKVKGIRRSEQSATDSASTESAMMELAACIQYDFDIFCLLQATSPTTKASDINNCLNQLIGTDNDSALSVVRTKRFIWSEDSSPINYDVFNRPRRQDFKGLLMENGAVYTTKKAALLNSRNRVSGKISLVEMTEETLYEIDEPNDFLVLEELLKASMQAYKKPVCQIKAIVFDVDGVLTDGKVQTGNGEELSKAFSLRDGMGISFLKHEGIVPIIMTSENSGIVHTRITKLGIQNYYPGVRDKFTRLTHVLKDLGITRNEVAYIGDDINDFANILSVGWSFSPANAVSMVQNTVDVNLAHNGGDLAARTAIEFIISFNKRF